MNKLNLSIAICTYNRAPELLKCLKSLSNANKKCVKLELIIIDDASSDSTKKIINNFIKKNVDVFTIYLRLSKNKNLGIIRNLALKKSSNDIVWFIDDDILLTKNWFVNLQKILESHADKAIIGGAVLPQITADLIPSWWSLSLLHGYAFAYLSYGEKSQILHIPDSLITANMGINKKVLGKEAYFDNCFGSDYKGLILGEDTELNWRADRKGFLLYYSPDIPVYHMIPDWKITKAYIKQKSAAWGNTEVTLYFRFKIYNVLIKEIFIKIKNLIVRLLKYNMNVALFHVTAENRFLVKQYIHFMEVSYIFSFLKNGLKRMYEKLS